MYTCEEKKLETHIQARAPIVHSNMAVVASLGHREKDETCGVTSCVRREYRMDDFVVV